MWSRWMAFGIGIVMSLPVVADGQVRPELRGQRVVAIEIAGETEGLTPPREVGIPIGARVSRRLFRAATRRLLESGQWRDVQFDILAEDDGVRIVAHLSPRTVLRRIDIVRNEIVDDDEIRRAMRLSTGSDFQRSELAERASAVEAIYRERGYEAARAEMILRDTNDPRQKVLLVRIFEGPPTWVREVVFEGQAPPRRASVLDVLEVEPGDTLDRRVIAERVREATIDIREAGYLEAELGEPTYRRTDQGVDVVLDAHFGPHYELRIVDFEPLERSDVESVLDLQTERLTTASADAARERVVDLYRRHGFLEAVASVEPVALGEPGEAALVIRPTPGERLEIRRLRFPGAEFFDQQFLEGQIYSYLQEDLPGSSFVYPVDTEVVDALGWGGDRRWRREVRAPLVVDPRRVYYEPTYASAIEHLKELYQAEGFLNAEVGPVDLSARAGQASITIPVIEGPRTILHRMQLRGNERIPSREILGAAGLSRGEPFSYLALEEARTRMVDLYRERGHLYARVEPNVRFSGNQTRAEVVLEIVEGVEVRVGRIIVQGLDLTSEALVFDRLRFASGDIYRPSQISASQERLAELGIFSGVSIGAQDPDLPAQIKPVIVTVTERLPQHIEWGGGVSTGEGVRGLLEYGYGNLFGYAIGISLRAQLAFQFIFIGDEVLQNRFEALPLIDRLERTVTASITIPHIPIFDNVGTSLDFFHLRDNERDFGLDRNGVGITLTWRPGRRFTGSANVSLENNNVDLLVGGGLDEFLRDNTDPRLERLLRVPEGESSIVATELSATLDYRDSPFSPTRGVFASVAGEYARTLSTESQEELPEPFESNFVKVTLTTGAYFPIFRNLVLATQARFGRVFHLNDNSKTYPNRAYYLGGVDSLRGYLQDALVPEDVAREVEDDPNLGANDVVRAGDSFLLLRGELRFPIVGDLFGGVFVDVGNVWADPTLIIDEFGLRPTAGLGLRLATPVGPLAFDYGFNLLRRSELKEPIGAFHFSIGLF
ncbi:MAG: POTRA domain-containing protein [Myxococcota bacterium]